MPGNEASSSWRSELLSSDGHGWAVLSIRGDRVQEFNAPARELFGGIHAGMPVDQLFDERSRAKAHELLSKTPPAGAELEIRQPSGPVGARFLVVAERGEKLLVATAIGIGYTEAIGAELMAANSELARLTRDLSRRVHELDAAKRALQEANEIERQLRAELEQLTRASSAVAESLTQMPSSDVSDVLTMVALQARALTNADYVALGIGTDEVQPFKPWVFLGVTGETASLIGHSPRPVGTLACVARQGKFIRAEDIRSHERFRGFPQHHPEMRSLLGVPIRHRGRPVGNLYLGKKPGEAPFTEQDERLIRMLAARVAVAIETALLYASESLQRVWLQNIIDQMPDGVLLYDEQGRVKAMNQACLPLTCEAPGRTDPYGNTIVLDAREPDGAVIPDDEAPMVRAFRHETPTFNREILVRRRDGGVGPVSVSAVPVRSAEGKISGVTMVLHDISGRIELERLREEWAAIVAHDLRQPVNAISMAAELLLRLRDGAVSDKERRAIERVRSASARLSRMICDLTDASRIEARRLSVEPRQVDVGALIDHLLEGLDDVTAHHPVQVTGAAHQLAWIDPDRIQQVLENILSNAAKYGDDDSAIGIDVTPRDQWIEITVTNRGPGIPPAQLALLFRRFTRTRAARDSGKPGLGLGLYIAKGLVEAHGGRLWAESTPGEATRFRFTLPRSPHLSGSSPHAAPPAPQLSSMEADQTT